MLQELCEGDLLLADRRQLKRKDAYREDIELEGVGSAPK